MVMIRPGNEKTIKYDSQEIGKGWNAIPEEESFPIYPEDLESGFYFNRVLPMDIDRDLMDCLDLMSPLNINLESKKIPKLRSLPPIFSSLKKLWTVRRVDPDYVEYLTEYWEKERKKG